jgi:hypothetical protein
MIPIIARLIPDEKNDEQAAGDADGQAKDIDQGEAQMLDEIPYSDFQGDQEHETLLIVYSLESTKFRPPRFPDTPASAGRNSGSALLTD